MCMLSYYPPGIVPNEDHIQNGAEINPDGHGFALINSRSQLSIFKSMNADEAVTKFMAARKADPAGPALFHSRISTSGLTDITGCHPFKVGSDNRTVVAHNGILFSPGRESMLSDTAIFANRMLPRFGSLDSPRKLAKLEKHVGYHNKLVVLTVNPQRRRNAYLINPEMGYWVDGQWHSNDGYKDWNAIYRRTRSGHTLWDTATGKFPWERGAYKSAEESADIFTTEPWPCNICGSVNAVDYVSQICDMCHCCNDCAEHKSLCLCYIPASVRNASAGKELIHVGGTTT